MVAYHTKINMLQVILGGNQIVLFSLKNCPAVLLRELNVPTSWPGAALPCIGVMGGVVEVGGTRER